MIGSLNMSTQKEKEAAKHYYCEKKRSTRWVHLDHIEPLHHNGPHILENLAASCPSCNGKKWCKPLSEWKPEGQQVFAL